MSDRKQYRDEDKHEVQYALVLNVGGFFLNTMSKSSIIRIMSDSESSPTAAAPRDAADKNPLPQPVAGQPQTKDSEIQADLQSCNIVEY